MGRYVALLRAINLGATRRVPMARLRELLETAGFDDIATYLQSGNVVLTSTSPAATVAEAVSSVLKREFGFLVPTVVRTAEQLQKVVDADPIAGAANDPSRYQVTFFDQPPDQQTYASVPREGWGDSSWRFHGGHLYTWTPGGIHADPMLRALGAVHAGTTGTARNWRTVTKVLELSGQ